MDEGGRYLGQEGQVPWGTPPTGVDRQTPVKTVPYRRTTYAVGNNLTSVLKGHHPNAIPYAVQQVSKYKYVV